MNANVLVAVFKRNFVSYFANPTGYVFICVFVLLSAFTAFWPNDFFNANLANLDQLNKFFPYVMLVFIPAITMSVWADERRQGTDELLLTIPAADLDIVLGKYLAAVAIYTVSLLFSLLCNYAVLEMLGDPDGGLFLGTYFGYWLVGLAMLAVGMAASFLTGNLTMAYVLGAVFNLPLVFASAEVLTVVVRAIISIPAAVAAGLNGLLLGISEKWTLLDGFTGQLRQAVLDVPPRVAMQVKDWGIPEQFAQFGRGVVSFAGLVYFAGIVAVMLYLCMVLIGRRHWRSGQLGTSACVFYPLLHGVSVLAFVVLYFLLRGHVAQFNLMMLLLGLYLLLHLGLIVAMSAGGSSAALLPGHFIVRTLALAGAAVGLVVFFQSRDLRIDVSSGRLNSLAPGTVELVKGLEVERVIDVEAFVSPESEVPESYVQTRLNLLNRLRELKAYGGEKIRLQIHNTELFSAEAARADQRYGITPRNVFIRERGARARQEIFMGVAFTCGLQKVVVPFIDRGTPIEYELVRSIGTVTQQKRKRLGVLDTDAGLYGNFMTGSSNWPIIDELAKQYEVKQVSAADLATNDEECEKQGMKALGLESAGEEDVLRKGLELLEGDAPLKTGPATFDEGPPRKAVLNAGTKQERTLSAEQIDKCKNRVREEAMKLGRFDVLLAVQPSSLSPEDLNKFVDAVRYGQPTAVFEDPCPRLAVTVPPTGSPMRYPPPGMNPMLRMGQPPMPKGDIRRLWDLLGVEFPADTVVWQDYNPYPMVDFFSEEKGWVFIGEGLKAKDRFNPEAAITAGLQTVLFPYPGEIAHRASAGLDFVELVRTGTVTGTFRYADVFEANPFGGPPRGLNPRPPRRMTRKSYVLAAEIRGKPKPDKSPAGEDAPGAKGNPHAAPREVSAVLVADIDLLSPAFFAIREQSTVEDLGVELDFDNVTFVLNVLDKLAGDERFIDVRKHRSAHRTLTRIEENVKESREQTAKRREELFDSYKKAEDDLRDALQKKIAELEKREDVDAIRAMQEISMTRESEERRIQARLDDEKQKRDQEINRIETELKQKIDRVRDAYKTWAVVLPPIPPLVVGIIVFVTRRMREREGVARSRLK